jgi:hypothetical protein
MNTPQLCDDRSPRRWKLRAQREQAYHSVLNGFDYLEVSEDQRTLTVYFFRELTQELSEGNFRIDGGRRIREIRVIRVSLPDDEQADGEAFLIITVNKPGDFSTYTVSVVEKDEQGRPTQRPLTGFDPRYSSLDFSFKVNCPNDFDCQTELVCPPVVRSEPEFDYLAKDYSSFRQLILDRLTLIAPHWQERHIPDLGITLIELLAYVGDYLSYYQDAVATEAYLDTARRRISVRRHVRLVDYRMHEGCNARTWICIETRTNLPELQPKDFYFTTGYDNRTLDNPASQSADSREFFEPMGAKPLRVIADHSSIDFYTWGEKQCCLPQGATAATLKDEWKTSNSEERRLHLKVNDFLLFEEVLGPKTLSPSDADPTHRHIVRLTRVHQDLDLLYGQPVVEVEWAVEDALPFALCLSAIGPPPKCQHTERISRACGNLVLVDHGRWIFAEDLGKVIAKDTLLRCEGEGHIAETFISSEPFTPQLLKSPLTFRQPLKEEGPATGRLIQDPSGALPQLELEEWLQEGSIRNSWTPLYDLLSSHGRDRNFVVEVDDEGKTHLRFGNDELGRSPKAGSRFKATYRVGNGSAGNVGAEKITQMLFRCGGLDGADIRVRNPLPARGGIDQESVAEVRQLAPHAFKSKLQRAITAEDYARLSEQNPKVQRAAANLRWTGSWYEAQVAIDSLGSETPGQALLNDIERYLQTYRRINHDTAVRKARYVPLHIVLQVCVLPDLRCQVKAELHDLFSNRILANGQRGYFHPDNLTFASPIYISVLVSTAQKVPGVQSVRVIRMERLNEGSNREIELGVLTLGVLEIAQMDNDPSFPENGKFELDLRGGR